jgi:CDP-2,3-bis-(O-geranylgeranyl)-sn-glycerol synthase
MNEIFLQATKILLYIIPLYVANSTALILAGKTRIDLNTKWIDGKELLGKGKTIKGTLFGITTGTITAITINTLFPQTTTTFYENYILLGLLLSTGAILGDMTASFIKRRSGIKQGAPVFLLDQLDFVIGGIITASIIHTPTIPEIIIICTITIITHKTSNWIAYKTHLKKVPW